LALLALVLASACLAEDRSVSYKFGDSPLPGVPQTGDWTTADNWSPTICLEYDSENTCIQKGYPGLQPGDATEFVFYKVTINSTPTLPPSPTPVDATLDLGVGASVAELTVGAQTTLNVAGALGLNRYNLPVSGPAPDWTEALLTVSGQVDVSGKIYSNGIAALDGSGKINLLGGNIEYIRLSNAAKIVGSGTFVPNSASGLAFSNSGTIDANVNGLPLTFNMLPPGMTVYNAGMLRASNGGKLRILGGASTTGPTGTLNNGAGTIAALDDSLVELFSVAITGGTLAGSGTGRFEVTDLNVRIGSLTIDGLLKVNDGKRLTLSGSVINNGTIRLDSTATATELHTFGSASDDHSLDGTGVLELTHATRSLVGSLSSSPGLINGTDHTIRGTGQIRQIKRLANWGLVDADVAGNALKISSTGGGTLTNTGVMRARNGATLDITGADSSNPVSINNAGGVIQAQDGSVVQLSYVTLTGGVLTTAGTGVIRLPTSVTAIGGLENLGTLDVRGSTTLLGGTLTNYGSMLLGSGSSGASLSVKPGVTLAGNGTLTLSNSSSNEISSWGIGTGTLTNETGHTIQGAGKIGAYGLALTNRGLITASQSNPLVLAESGVAANLTNEGTLRAGKGSTLQVNQNLTNFNPATHTLSGGRYEVLGTMRLPVAGGIANNAADIVLDGAASRLYEGVSGTTDALAGFVVNQNTGRFEVRNGRNFALGVFNNSGSMNVGAGSVLTATSYTQNAGLTDVDGSLQVLGDIVIDGGVLTGSGTVAGNLVNNGNVAPGNSPGTMNVNGNYSQVTGTLGVELGALVSDQLLVSGTASIGGVLDVSLWSAPGEPLFAPGPGQQFDLLLAQVVSGQFLSVNLPQLSGIAWDLDYLIDANGSTDIVRLTASAVPLPPAFWLAGTAFVAAAVRARRRRTARCGPSGGQ
jgi:fibronectin-binding autotransporter adhesin